jgi:hypothetical protein
MYAVRKLFRPISVISAEFSVISAEFSVSKGLTGGNLVHSGNLAQCSQSNGNLALQEDVTRVGHVKMLVA